MSASSTQPIQSRAAADGFEEIPLERPALLQRALGDEGTGYLMSFVLHVIALLILAIPLLPAAIETGLPPPIRVARLDDVLHDDAPEMIEFDIEDLGSPPTPLNPTTIAREKSDLLLPSLLHQETSAAATSDGQELGQDEAMRAARNLPKHAVIAGNFAAWWIPKKERYGETVEAGQLPRVGQDYYITVQLELPKDQKSLRVTDLSGDIIGSDGYKQNIPDRAWIYDGVGKLERVLGHRLLKVTDGHLQIVFKVPGAGKPDVQDTITVRSKTLDEEQTITLVFQAIENAP